MEELVGRKVVGFDWSDNLSAVSELGWNDDILDKIGEIGIITAYCNYDNSFKINFDIDNHGYWHPADMAINHLVEEPSQLDQLTNLFYDLLDTLERDNTIPNEIVITNKELFLKAWRREIKKIVNKD